MYGLLLEAIMDHLSRTYGEDKWEEIRRRAGVKNTCFSTHETYSEQTIPRIAAAAQEVVGISEEEIMDGFGVAFVNFVSQYGYNSMLQVLGRHMRDFLNGLDNLHEYLRFSYPKLRPPSFFVENENRGGLTLHYRSRRRGYLHYVKGQIRQVGEVFYNTKVDIYVVGETFNPEDNTTHVTFRLQFDNVGFKDMHKTEYDSIIDKIPLRSELLFELFPFHVVFGRDMKIRNVGSALSAVIPDAVGKSLQEVFYLARPLTHLSWNSVMAHTNNVFELVSLQSVKKDVSTSVLSEGNKTDKEEEKKAEEEDEKADDKERSRHSSSTDSDKEEEDEDLRIRKEFEDDTDRLHVKGQMMFMSEWDAIMFLGTPIMKSLDDMFNSGLYINDLSMHDSSRDLVLAGTQQSAELKLALDQEQEKSRLLEESMKKLDSEMKRTDALLYQMIPKPVADRLRRGEPSVNTCQVFDSVTILFSDVVGFTTICSKISPMEVVSMLNAMYTEFDQLSEKHDVYKVETIGDAYMAVAGAPTVTRFHALAMCNMSLDMLGAVKGLKDPSKHDHMRIRVGIHSGTTVAGVVGIKMPRYCLFGDTVNTASRMETNGEAMKIHISETTRQELIDFPYSVEERGEITVKGKGTMKTYWLLGRDDNPARKPKCPFQQLMEEERKAHHGLSRVPSSYNVSSPRPVYSPVSFDDVHPETPQSHSAHHSPSHLSPADCSPAHHTQVQQPQFKDSNGQPPQTLCSATLQSRLHDVNASADKTGATDIGRSNALDSMAVADQVPARQCPVLHQSPAHTTGVDRVTEGPVLKRADSPVTYLNHSAASGGEAMSFPPPGGGLGPAVNHTVTTSTAPPSTTSPSLTMSKPMQAVPPCVLPISDASHTFSTSSVTTAVMTSTTPTVASHQERYPAANNNDNHVTKSNSAHALSNHNSNALVRNNDKTHPTTPDSVIPTRELDSGKGPVPSSQKRSNSRQSNHIIKYTSPRVSPQNEQGQIVEKSKSKTCAIV